MRKLGFTGGQMMVGIIRAAAQVAKTAHRDIIGQGRGPTRCGPARRARLAAASSRAMKS